MGAAILFCSSTTDIRFYRYRAAILFYGFWLCYRFLHLQPERHVTSWSSHCLHNCSHSPCTRCAAERLDDCRFMLRKNAAQINCFVISNECNSLVWFPLQIFILTRENVTFQGWPASFSDECCILCSFCPTLGKNFLQIRVGAATR